MSARDVKSNKRVRGSALSVRFLLMSLAVIPLAGAAWFATEELARTSRGRDESSRVTQMVQDHATLSRLKSSVLDERNWVLVTQGIQELGISSEIVNLFNDRYYNEAQAIRTVALVQEHVKRVSDRG